MREALSVVKDQAEMSPKWFNEFEYEHTECLHALFQNYLTYFKQSVFILLFVVASQTPFWDSTKVKWTSGSCLYLGKKGEPTQ